MARTGQAYSTAIADSINAFLKEDKWRFDFDSERGRFIFNLSLSCKLKSVRYIVDVREKDYLIYVFSPLGPDKGDAATMKRTAEFLTSFVLLACAIVIELVVLSIVRARMGHTGKEEVTKS